MDPSRPGSMEGSRWPSTSWRPHVGNGNRHCAGWRRPNSLGHALRCPLRAARRRQRQRYPRRLHSGRPGLLPPPEQCRGRRRCGWRLRRRRNGAPQGHNGIRPNPFNGSKASGKRSMGGGQVGSDDRSACPQHYPEPASRISTMLRWMVATDASSLTLLDDRPPPKVHIPCMEWPH